MRDEQYQKTCLERFAQELKPLRDDLDLFEEICSLNMSDNVNSPEHYQSNTGLEVIDVIESFDLNYNLGNVIKYVLRCRKKGRELEDLKKAFYYLNREIAKIESEDDDE